MLPGGDDLGVVRADGGVAHDHVDVTGEAADAQSAAGLPAQAGHLGGLTDQHDGGVAHFLKPRSGALTAQTGTSRHGSQLLPAVCDPW
jgi:hypothetical protein